MRSNLKFLNQNIYQLFSQFHVSVADFVGQVSNLIDIVTNEQELRDKHADGTLNTLFAELKTAAISLLSSLEAVIQGSIRMRSNVISLSDGGFGVSVYQRLCRLMMTATCLICDFCTFDRIHNAGGHSSQQLAEHTVAAVKELSSTKHPISHSNPNSQNANSPKN
eukprot:58084_1